MPKRAYPTTSNSSPKKPKTDSVVHPLIDPNYTIYICNLNDKIPSITMKKSLYVLFSTYCDVIGIYYRNRGKLRGQAWIVVSSIEEAELAILRLRGISVFGKDIRMEFSKSESKIIETLKNSA